MTAVSYLRDRARTWQLNADALQDQGDQFTFLACLITAVVLGELAHALEHTDDDQ